MIYRRDRCARVQRYIDANAVPFRDLMRNSDKTARRPDEHAETRQTVAAGGNTLPDGVSGLGLRARPAPARR
jgi:hypothetical protein